MNRDYDTLVDAINGLRTEGYTHDFNFEIDCLTCKQINKKYASNAFDVDGIFRFEGASNPSDNSILYAITTNEGEKGVLVDGYGISGGQISKDLMDKLKVKGRK